MSAGCDLFFFFGLTLPNYRNKSRSAQRSPPPPPPPLISTTSSAAVCVHTLFIFFFDNVLHETERVSCVCVGGCVVKLMLCPTIKYWLATPLQVRPVLFIPCFYRPSHIMNTILWHVESTSPIKIIIDMQLIY